MAIDNRCEKCGGELLYNFDGKTLKCAQCDQTISIPVEMASSNKNFFDGNSTIKKKLTDKITYKCENCGKNNIFDINTKSIRCTYCGSPNLNVASEIEYIPDGIIPFTLNKKEAIQCFLNWLGKKKFLPKNLKRKISQCVLSPIYYPIYNYDFNCFSSYSGIGVNYEKNAEGVQNVTKTPFSGTKREVINNYLTSATTSISQLKLVSFGNYNFSRLNVFKTEYLYGIKAVSPNIDLQQSCRSARGSIEYMIQTEIKNSYKYDEIKNFVCKTTFERIAYHHLYVPVWIHSFNYNKNKYSVFINGSTGEISGRVPRSALKILATIFGILLGGGLVALLIYLLTL